MDKSKTPLFELASTMTKYPQILINVKDVKKENLSTSVKIKEAIASAEQQLGSKGRVLLRASGTEALVRVMVEADELPLAQKIADSLAQLVRLELK
jgi:phosphoglucosamine mutase